MQIAVQDIAKLGALYHEYNFDLHALYAVLEVESSGSGFKNGKPVIQFEAHHFKRLAPKAPNTGIWNNNTVSGQSEEWKAFNDAFKLHPEAAMQATSIGLMQVMGFNYKRCGFDSIHEFWDYAKASELNQLDVGIRYIVADSKLVKAINSQDWDAFAYGYNGKNYKKYNYHTRLRDAYLRAKAKIDLTEVNALIEQEINKPVPKKSWWQRLWAWLKGGA